MQYQEFLKLSGATKSECEFGAYQKYIERAYMENDDIFPDKDDVVEHWHRFGLLGFLPDFIAHMKEATKALRKVYRRGLVQSADRKQAFTEFLARAAERV